MFARVLGSCSAMQRVLAQPLACCTAARALHVQVFACKAEHADSDSPQPSGSSRGPLEGIKVLDLGQVVAGNFCGAALAYFGADVIKVEPPGRGDALRSLRMLDSSGTSLWWRSYGRNRKCITLDLRQEAGREVAKRLANRSDVLIENFRPGVMEKWGLGPKDLKPELVYTRISGYGQTGPKASSPGYASSCEAYGGFRYINGYPDRAPVRPNISLGDTLAGLHAAFGAVMALLHRARNAAATSGGSGTGDGGGGTGGGGGSTVPGQVVDAAITESVFNMLEACVPEFAAHGAERQPSGSTISGVVPSGTWRTRDGHWCVIGGNGDSVYTRLMEAVGRPDMGAGNADYATDAKRWEQEAEICEAIDTWVAAHDEEEVLAKLSAARVPCGPILSIGEMMAEEQYRSRGMFQTARPPSGGEQVTLPALLPVMSGTPGGTRWAGPELGEHTEEVLVEELGMGREELEELRRAGVV